MSLMSWIALDPPVRVRAFIADQWHEAVADEYETETHELRVRWPPFSLAEDETGRPTGLSDFHEHIVLEPSRYQELPGAPLPRPAS